MRKVLILPILAAAAACGGEAQVKVEEGMGPNPLLPAPATGWRNGARLPERFRNDMFVGQHGSWNRKSFSGYRVIFVPFADGVPSGQVADDVGNVIWRVSAKE